MILEQKLFIKCWWNRLQASTNIRNNEQLLDSIVTLTSCFKLSCDIRFQCAFTACCCVFKVITLVWANQGNYFENVNACSKCTLKTTVATQLNSTNLRYICCDDRHRNLEINYSWTIEPHTVYTLIFCNAFNIHSASTSLLVFSLKTNHTVRKRYVWQLGFYNLNLKSYRHLKKH